MPNNKVFYHSSPYHGNNYILSLAFNFDKEEDVYQFAFSYPYSYSLCQAHLEQLDRRAMPFFRRDLLGHSLQKRRVDLLTITHPDNMVPSVGKVHVVVILGRVHPGESPASYVCQGIIDFLISNHPTAVLLREKIVFKIIPMLNPDGVFLGNQRCSQVGADLNRTWNKISKWLHPTVYAAYTFITSLDQDKDIELDIILDIHAHTNLRGVFVSGNTYSDVYRYERHIVFPKQLSQNVLGFENGYTVYNRDMNKSGSSRRLLCDLLKSTVNCYSLIVSFHGYCGTKSSGFKYYTEEGYYKVGRNVVKAFYDYYKNCGVIQGVGKKAAGAEKKSGRGIVLSGWRKPGMGASRVRAASAPMRGQRLGTVSILELRLRPCSRAGWIRHLKQSGKKERGRDSPASVYLPPPAVSQISLSIIDFNRLTRGTLENAASRISMRK